MSKTPDCMITTATTLFRRLGLACAVVATVVSSPAAEKTENIPIVWPASIQLAHIHAGVPHRVLTDDETWNAQTPRFQDLDTGAASRTIVLAPIGAGADAIAPGTTFFARVTARAGHRIQFRRHDGQLLTMWSGDGPNAEQWAILRAGDERWDVRTSPGKHTPHRDPVFAWLGAAPAAPGGAGDSTYAQPAHPRTRGFAIRFETDASVFFVACRAQEPRFRVVSDGRMIADVFVPERSGEPVHIPIELGAPSRRRIEILADTLQFRGIELPDARNSVLAWNQAVPPARMLWIGDRATERGTTDAPWVLGQLMNAEVFSRQWGDFENRIAGSGDAGAPLDAIAEDVSGVNPDLIIVSTRFFNPELAPRDFSVEIDAWLDAIKQAARPEAVIVVLSPLAVRNPADRTFERRANAIAKSARERELTFVNWHSWLTGTVEEPANGNAINFMSADFIHPTADGHAWLAGKLLETIRKLGLEAKIQTATVKRRQSDQLDRLALTP